MDMMIPVEYKTDLEIALNLLKAEGCTDIYLFGSLAENNYNSLSDIDIAVNGLRKDKFFHVYGKLLKSLSHPFDLVGLDYDDDFSRELLKSGTLKRVS